MPKGLETLLFPAIYVLTFDYKGNKNINLTCSETRERCISKIESLKRMNETGKTFTVRFVCVGSVLDLRAFTDNELKDIFYGRSLKKKPQRNKEMFVKLMELPDL